MHVFMYYYTNSGTGTWWGRNFVSMALTFRLATVTLCKMGALLEKLVDVESGAKSYVKLILGWVQSIRALQARQGEPEKNWISIYDFVVFMVDNCPENIGAAGGVCVLLEAQRRLAYDEMACSGVRGDQLGNYVVSEVANCGLHIVNTFSANYNRTWKAVEESFINEGVDKASRDSDGDDAPESFDTSMVDGGGEGGGRGGGAMSTTLVGSEHDAKHGLWQRAGAGKSAAESKAMAYARWAFKSLSTAVTYRAWGGRGGEDGGGTCSD